MQERLMRIEEVAMVLNVNQYTIERWYKFKRENPDNQYVSLLPDFVYQTNSKNRSVRYWRPCDIKKFQEFQETIVKGTKGFMGSVTNLQKKRSEKDGEKKVNGNGKCRSKRSEK